MLYNLRFRNGAFARWKWPCKIGWHAQRMKYVDGQRHFMLVCACCPWKEYGGRCA